MLVKLQIVVSNSMINNITFSSENDVLSESGEIYLQLKHSLQVKTVLHSSK